MRSCFNAAGPPPSSIARWPHSSGGGANARPAALHGGHQGLRALTTGDWRSLDDASDDWLADVETSPGMALGGGRDRLTAPELDDGLARLASGGIRTLFLIGGNGTIAAGRALSLRRGHGHRCA